MLDIHKEKETKMDIITATMVKTMMHDIDVRLDRKSHYDPCFGLYGLTYHVGAHKYVTFEDFSNTFEEYEVDNKGAEWACYLYILAKNQPELLNLFVRSYNLGGMETLETLIDDQIEHGTQPTVYAIQKH